MSKYFILKPLSIVFYYFKPNKHSFFVKFLFACFCNLTQWHLHTCPNTSQVRCMWLMKCFEATVRTFWKYEFLGIYLKPLLSVCPHFVLFVIIVSYVSVSHSCCGSPSSAWTFQSSYTPPRSVWMFDSDFIMSIFGHFSTFISLISAWVIQHS